MVCLSLPWAVSLAHLTPPFPVGVTNRHLKLPNLLSDLGLVGAGLLWLVLAVDTRAFSPRPSQPQLQSHLALKVDPQLLFSLPSMGTEPPATCHSVQSCSL